MKIIDALKYEGYPYEIKDCNRNDLPAFFVEMGYKVGVEVGVFEGEFLVNLCKVGLKMYGVDPWINYDDYTLYEKQQHKIYHTARTALAPYKNCTLIRKTSMKAVTYFPENSIDFVYIDANHGLKYVVEDIWEWTKRVRVGGVVSGHDYSYVRRSLKETDIMHVKDGVNAYTKVFKIPFYILGRTQKYRGEKRDTWRSWMFIKKGINYG